MKKTKMTSEDFYKEYYAYNDGKHGYQDGEYMVTRHVINGKWVNLVSKNDDTNDPDIKKKYWRITGKGTLADVLTFIKKGKDGNRTITQRYRVGTNPTRVS